MSQLRYSVPGQPTRVIQDRDPFLGLSQRQRDILAALRAHNGNRSRAARQLGISVASVQAAVRLAQQAGAPVPAIARRGPDLRPRQQRGRAA